MLIVRRDFRIFSNLLVSFHAFAGNFGKNVGKRGVFTNKIIAYKKFTVKLTLAKRTPLAMCDIMTEKASGVRL